MGRYRFRASVTRSVDFVVEAPDAGAAGRLVSLAYDSPDFCDYVDSLIESDPGDYQTKSMEDELDCDFGLGEALDLTDEAVAASAASARG